MKKIFPARFQIEWFQQKNNPPEVNIIEPENKSVQPVNTLIPYSINISDGEDGESKYEEIPFDKVLLEVKYVNENPENALYLEKDKPEKRKGLLLINKFDCFTCHQFKTRLIGPPFQEIAQKYSITSSASQ
jgi:cytochrome c